MNGGADLGGMMGFGPVADSAEDAPNYKADWEARVMGMVVALGACGAWNLDQSRFSRESLPPADYLSWPYYRIWLEGVSKLLLARGMVTEEELARGKMEIPPAPVKGCLTARDVPATLARGGPVDRPAFQDAAFAEGQRVQARNIHPESHTRLPRYARGKSGVITRLHGCHVFPDTNALGQGESPAWLYQVRFSAQELWGPEASEADSVTLDLWEPYLEAAL